MEFELCVNGSLLPVIELTWLTYRVGKPAKISAVLPKIEPSQEMGQVVTLSVDGQKRFHGYVFDCVNTHDRRQIVAYDQLRYLMFKDSYLFDQKTADEIISLISKDMGLALGDICSTSYPIDLVIEDKKLIDIIQAALQITFEQTGKRFTLWDDNGKLTLDERGSLDSGLLINPESLMTAYNQGESIDIDSFNRIKLAQKDKKKGIRSVVIESDEGTAADWGNLQYFEYVDEKLNTAQITAQAKQLLEEKNRPTKTLTINAVGHPDLRSGVNLAAQLDDETAFYVIERACHKWNGPRYEMTLDLEIL